MPLPADSRQRTLAHWQDWPVGCGRWHGDLEMHCSERIPRTVARFARPTDARQRLGRMAVVKCQWMRAYDGCHEQGWRTCIKIFPMTAYYTPDVTVAYLAAGCWLHVDPDV